MHPTATPFTELRAALAPRAGANACPHLRARDALLALLFQQLDRLFASLERLFTAWQAGTMPPPPPPRPRTVTPRAVLRHSVRARIWRTPRPAAVRHPITAPGASATIPALPCQRQPAPAPRATPQHPIPHHGPDPPHLPPRHVFHHPASMRIGTT